MTILMIIYFYLVIGELQYIFLYFTYPDLFRTLYKTHSPMMVNSSVIIFYPLIWIVQLISIFR